MITQGTAAMYWKRSILLANDEGYYVCVMRLVQPLPVITQIWF